MKIQTQCDGIVEETMKMFGGNIIRLGVILCLIPVSLAANLKSSFGDFDFDFYGMFKPETFFGKNTALLNNNNPGNQTWYARHTLDLNLDVLYGREKYGRSVIEMLLNIRNRGNWGNPESIATTTSSAIKRLDIVESNHSHAIPRHIVWLREAWVEFFLNQAFGLPISNEHYFKLGLFPFELGRGIALGDAYAVGQGLLGFYTDSIVDQYAPGAVLHGDIINDRLSYDLYAAILQNKSASLGDTNAEILGQKFGRRKTPQRGSGSINFLLAGRFNWDPFNNDKVGRLHVEPYALYNRDPEQMVEFLGDAASQLGTVGLAAEYAYKRFEIGFDYAFNMGQQKVFGWDRNTIDEENRNGYEVVVNTQVVDQNKKKILYIKGSDAQQLIDCAPQDASQNGKNIGTVAGNVGFVPGPVTLTNSAKRFRNPYVNKYKGWMFVIDSAYWLLNKDLQLAATAGIATGDENPNNETIDGTYTGFISLQEMYSGKRVKSAYVLGGAGRLRRPLSAPESVQAPSGFAPSLDRFNNLVFVGAGLKWKPSQFTHEFVVHPNVLSYWQEKPTKKFDAQTMSQLNCLASTYLGTELNLFSHYKPYDCLKVYMVGSVFFPGSHYRDIRGKPINAAEAARLAQLDATGFDVNLIPNIGTDTSYTLNVGVEFNF